MKGLAAVLAVVCFFVAGCSRGSKKAVAEALDKSFRQGRANVSIFVYCGRTGDKCEDAAKKVFNTNPTTDASYIAAEKAGLISVTADGPDYWKIDVLDMKPAFRERLKTIPHPTANGCDYQSIEIPLAKKSVIEVTRINAITDETVEVEYKWKWAITPEGEKAINRLSSSQLMDLRWENVRYMRFHDAFQPSDRFTFSDLADSTAPRDGKAMLKKAKDGWEVAK
jgi:hypothetical protein